MNLNSKPHRRTVVGLGSLGANLIAAFAANTAAAPFIQPHSIGLNAMNLTGTNDANIRLDDTIDKPGTAFTSAPNGHDRGIATLTSQPLTAGQRALDEATKYARSVTQAIDGGITLFANDFNFGATVGDNQINRHPALGGS